MNREEIEQKIAGLRRGFNKCYEESHAKEQLLTEEIGKHELLFDDKRLPLPVELHTSRRPIKGLRYTDGDILQIREAYNKYIVYGGDIADAGEYYYVNPKDVNRDDEGNIDDIVVIDNRGRIAKKFPPSDIQLHFYEIAVARWEHLSWLKSLMIPTKVEREEVTILEEACISDKALTALKAWFIREGLCDKDTFKWKGKKRSLINFLIELHTKDYTIELTQNEMQNIAENSFGCKFHRSNFRNANGHELIIQDGIPTPRYSLPAFRK